MEAVNNAPMGHRYSTSDSPAPILTRENTPESLIRAIDQEGSAIAYGNVSHFNMPEPTFRQHLLRSLSRRKPGFVYTIVTIEENMSTTGNVESVEYEITKEYERLSGVVLYVVNGTGCVRDEKGDEYILHEQNVISGLEFAMGDKVTFHGVEGIAARAIVHKEIS